MTTEKAIEFGKIFLKSIENEKGSAIYEFVETAVKMMEQQPILNKIRAEIEEATAYEGLYGIYIDRAYVLQILDKYEAESEV